MNRRGAGITLIAIAAFLFGIDYLSGCIFEIAGLFMHFDPALNAPTQYYQGPQLRSIATIIGLAGVVYVIWAEVEALATRRK